MFLQITVKNDGNFARNLFPKLEKSLFVRNTMLEYGTTAYRFSNIRQNY